MATLFVVALVTARPSSGFCMQPVPTPECEFLNSDAIFIGRVGSYVYTAPPHQVEDEGWLYTLTVKEVLRGRIGAKAKVFTGNNSARFTLDVGRQYLIFAQDVEGTLLITNCGHSALLPAAQGTIARLRRLKIPKDAEIEGRISFSGIPNVGTHVAGFHVTVRGQGRIYKAISDADGWFHLSVPPGEYSAEVEDQPHWGITRYDLSVDEPSRFVARKGRCTGLQFLASPR